MKGLTSHPEGWSLQTSGHEMIFFFNPKDLFCYTLRKFYKSVPSWHPLGESDLTSLDSWSCTELAQVTAASSKPGPSPGCFLRLPGNLLGPVGITSFK